MMRFKNLNYNKKKYFTIIEELIKNFFKKNEKRKIEDGFLFLCLITFQLNFFSVNFSNLFSFLINKVYSYILENKNLTKTKINNLKNIYKEKQEKEIIDLKNEIKNIKLKNWHEKQKILETNVKLITKNEILKKDLEKKVINLKNNKNNYNNNFSLRKETILYNIEKKENEKKFKLKKKTLLQKNNFKKSSFKIQLMKSSTENLLSKIDNFNDRKKSNTKFSKKDIEKRKLDFRKRFTKLENFESSKTIFQTQSILDYNIIPLIKTKNAETQTLIKKKNKGIQTFLNFNKSIFDPIFANEQNKTEKFIKELLFLKNLNVEDIIKNNKNKFMENLIKIPKNIPKHNIINNKYKRKSVLNSYDIKKASFLYSLKEIKKPKFISKNFLLKKNVNYFSVKRIFKEKISTMIKIKRIEDVFFFTWPKNERDFRDFKKDEILVQFLENSFTKSIDDYFLGDIKQDSIHFLIKILIMYQLKFFLLEKKVEKNDFCIKFLKNIKFDYFKKDRNKNKFFKCKRSFSKGKEKIISKKNKKRSKSLDIKKIENLYVALNKKNEITEKFWIFDKSNIHKLKYIFENPQLSIKKIKKDIVYDRWNKTFKKLKKKKSSNKFFRIFNKPNYP